MIQFDEDGVCLPCRYFEQNLQEEIDWEERWNELLGIAEWGRENSKCEYDCIIGVSGGKDSTRQALIARNDLGLNPLLVSCTYPPEQLTEIGAVNLANLIGLGFDTVTVSPNPHVWKFLMRKGVKKFGNWCKSTEMALKACLPRMAIAYHIPLVLVGENPALSSGDWAGSLGGDGNRWQHSHTLAGGPKTLLDADDEVSDQDLFWYTYPSEPEIARAGLRVIFLGYYIPDFNWKENARVAIEHGLVVREDPPEDTGNIKPYDQLDDDFVFVNQWLKFLKFGFGKATDHVCEDVRAKRISREEGIELIRKYDGKCAPRFIDAFCRYLEISKEGFLEMADSYRNLDLWDKTVDGEWRLRSPIWDQEK